MTHWQRWIGWLAFMLLLQAGTEVTADAQQTRRDLLERSDIVVVATVTKMGAASFEGVPVTARTLVARVDGILQKPAAVRLVEGDAVTIEVREAAPFREGVRATFYGQGWILGAGVALREVGHVLHSTSPQATTIIQQRDSMQAMQRQIEDARLRQRIEAAALVVVGRVTSVGSATTEAVGAPPGPISEHNPDWREAVIAVESAIKGAQAGQQVVVRFPASLDVAWFDTPKLREGQEGVFILQRDQVSGATTALLAGTEVAAYTALNSVDVLPRQEAQRVRGLARGAGG